MPEWILSAGDPYPWHASGAIAFKGYVWRGRSGPLAGEKAASLFSGIQKQAELQNLLDKLEGVFSVMIRADDGILAGCDPMGFFPVFYTSSDVAWIVSDDPYLLSGTTGSRTPNTQARAEFLSGGHVMGDETLIRGVRRLRPGEALFLKNGLAREDGRPFAFVPSGSSSSDAEALKDDLFRILDAQARDMVEYLGGRTAVIPLSGGYDSRLIACMLKKAGYERVVCLTYGRHNQETGLSERVARTLGFPWHFVDYDRLDVGHFSDDPLFRDYCRYAGNLVSMPFLQEYFAVKFLKENDLLPADSVFLPGHPGDNLGGSFISRGAKGEFQDTARHIVRTFFPFVPHDKDTERHLELRARHWLPSHLSDSAGKIPGYTPAVETWNFSERLPKFIFNSARVFPFFGYRVYFPLWSRRMASFFSRIPYSLRDGKKLYDEVLESRYFGPLNVVFGSGEIPGKRPLKIPRALRRLGWNLLPSALLRKKAAKADWICYGKFTAELGRSLKAQGKKPLERYRSLNALICQWYLENEWK